MDSEEHKRQRDKETKRQRDKETKRQVLAEIFTIDFFFGAQIIGLMALPTLGTRAHIRKKKKQKGEKNRKQQHSDS